MSREALDKKLQLLEMSKSVQTAISKAVARSLFRTTNEPKENYAYLTEIPEYNHVVMVKL